jgi:hypothetical protein
MDNRNERRDPIRDLARDVDSVIKDGGAGDDDLVPGVSLGRATSPAPTPTGLRTAEQHEAWLAEERRLAEERAERERRVRDENDRRTAAAIARVRALGTGWKADGGPDQFCRHCGVKFDVDEQGRGMHVANECAGPKPPPCRECGAGPELRTRGGFRTWEFACSPADHARRRAETNPATNIELQRPRRVGRGDEDDEQ